MNHNQLRLITQRDDSCREKYSRPTNYTQDNLLAYGANRWKRVEALADEFARYWKDYLYQIGTNREKWYQSWKKFGSVVACYPKIFTAQPKFLAGPKNFGKSRNISA